MANVVESPVFFTDGKSVVKMGKDGSIKCIGEMYREIPFEATKLAKFGGDLLKYAISRTNLQGLKPSTLDAFNAMQKSVLATRKENAKKAMTLEAYDEIEVETLYEQSIETVSRLTVELADAKAELSAIRVVYKGGADKAAKEAKKAKDKAEKDAKDAAYKAELARIAKQYGKKSIAGVAAA